ncbi:hypothetical protein LL037_18960 [Clostridium estertheticum]|uniref:hypothetical protein n=1 Tax=Clostridium estertheticum TaxID=238834 RepID=UPI001C0D4128|nr:hypothetical protein [Clostridium estertheticum]MBU3198546.1 hypothetical protein [Clostridium estertheticum]WAG64526.1 hypothetical protein LL037_18960 [Clostridium estertheticum]
MPRFLIPESIYLLGCDISYSMGSAWSAWALIIGSVLVVGSFGYNESPLGETAMLSSSISGAFD